MSIKDVLILTGIMALGTMLTRFLPFICFPDNKKPPKMVLYLGGTLPFAAIGLLVIYCFKDISFLHAPFGAPKLIAAAAVILLHLWKKNTLLSIGGGTLFYILLLRFIF